jgi:hypothetical protein
MLAYENVSFEQKLTWLKYWNESDVLQETKIFPMFGLFDVQFDKWLHKATFKHQVNILIQFILWIFPICFNFFDCNIYFLFHAVGGSS